MALVMACETQAAQATRCKLPWKRSALTQPSSRETIPKALQEPVWVVREYAEHIPSEECQGQILLPDLGLEEVADLDLDREDENRASPVTLQMSVPTSRLA
jgi:hypothetical protein